MTASAKVASAGSQDRCFVVRDLKLILRNKDNQPCFLELDGHVVFFTLSWFLSPYTHFTRQPSWIEKRRCGFQPQRLFSIQDGSGVK